MLRVAIVARTRMPVPANRDMQQEVKQGPVLGCSPLVDWLGFIVRTGYNPTTFHVDYYCHNSVTARVSIAVSRGGLRRGSATFPLSRVLLR